MRRIITSALVAMMGGAIALGVAHQSTTPTVRFAATVGSPAALERAKATVSATESALTAAKQTVAALEAPEEAPPPKEETPPPPPKEETASTYGGFSASNPMRGPPGSPSSPFNQPVGASPTVLANSAEMVAYVLRQGSPMPGNATSSSDWKHPTVFASNSDPVVELRATEAWGTNSLTGRKVHVPAAVQAAPPPGSSGGDAHLEIVLAPVDARVPGEAADLWRATPVASGVLRFAWGGPANIAGTGIGGAATAVGLDLWGGQIRGIELKERAINHAICATVKANKSGSFVYPATHTDGRSSEAAAPQEGQRFYLAYSDSEIEALPLKPWKKTVLKALAHYGFYDCDSGGSGLGIEFESPIMFTAFGQPNPLAEVGKAEGLGTWEGAYVFNFSEGVNWSRLRAITPPPH